MQAIVDNERALRLFKVIALQDDLRRRSEVLNGNDGIKGDFLVLDPENFESLSFLNSFFTGAARTKCSLAVNSIEESKLLYFYFELANLQADVDKSEFLKDWVKFEVTLRNVLAKARSKRLGLKNVSFAKIDGVESENSLAGFFADFETVYDPLQCDQLVERTRWSWLMSNDSWFQYSDDEVVAYGVKLLTLHRWYRIIHGNPVASNTFVVPIQ